MGKKFKKKIKGEISALIFIKLKKTAYKNQYIPIFLMLIYPNYSYCPRGVVHFSNYFDYSCAQHKYIFSDNRISWEDFIITKPILSQSSDL